MTRPQEFPQPNSRHGTPTVPELFQSPPVNGLSQSDTAHFLGFPHFRLTVVRIKFFPGRRPGAPLRMLLKEFIHPAHDAFEFLQRGEFKTFPLPTRQCWKLPAYNQLQFP